MAKGDRRRPHRSTYTCSAGACSCPCLPAALSAKAAPPRPLVGGTFLSRSSLLRPCPLSLSLPPLPRGRTHTSNTHARRSGEHILTVLPRTQGDCIIISESRNRGVDARWRTVGLAYPCQPRPPLAASNRRRLALSEVEGCGRPGGLGLAGFKRRKLRLPGGPFGFPQGELRCARPTAAPRGDNAMTLHRTPPPLPSPTPSAIINPQLPPEPRVE